MKTNRITRAGRRIARRSFLKGCLTAGAFSLIAPRLSFAAAGSGGGPVAASGKVNLACCGIGNRGAEVINALFATGNANIVALCDVDMEAPHTTTILKKFPDAPRFKDFREMFDKMGGQIDAVSVATPDFSHFPIAMLAMSLGKHVYCEKPMAHSFLQTELMMQAEKKYKVAAQMGNQGHSDANYFQFKTWVDAGIIRNVTKIIAFMNNSRRWHGMDVSGYLPGQPIPETLDWDRWLATAQFHEYNKGYINGDWRSWFDFGNGALGDWGAHIIDTAHEFLNLGLPSEVDSVKSEGHNKFIFPQASTLSFKFPKRGNMPPVEITWYDGQQNLPPLPDAFGQAVVDANIPPPSTGQIDTKRNPPGKVIYGEELTFKGGSHGSTLQIIPESKAKDMASKLPQVPRSSSNHFLNFLRAAKGEEKCRSSFAVAGPLCQVMALGVLAQQFNTKLEFDRDKKQITNNKAANQLLAGVPPRKDWEQFYKL
jgi:predicted dehydrogenase